MKVYLKILTIIALIHDVVAGLCLLFASGFVHELTVGALVRTTFYIPQALGLVVLCRGVSLLACRCRPGARCASGLAHLWGAQAIVCAMIAVILSGESGHAQAVYFIWALSSTALSIQFWKQTVTQSQPAS